MAKELNAKQIAILKHYTHITHFTDLADEVQERLLKLNNHETTHHAISRYLWDNKAKTTTSIWD